jgi:hypothetical protein
MKKKPPPRILAAAFERPMLARCHKGHTVIPCDQCAIDLIWHGEKWPASYAAICKAKTRMEKAKKEALKVIASM